MTSHLALIQPNYSEKINHIRTAGAFWIFAFHYYHFIAHSFFTPLASLNPFLLLVYHGYFCVYLFFVLSGFLLTKTYTEQLDLKSFFTKRIGRIFPAYYLCIVIYCLLFTTGMPPPKLLIAIFSNDLGIYPGTIGHLWFVNRLLECYLSFPLLWWITQKTGQAGLSLIYLCCLLGGGYWVIDSKVSLPDYYFSFVLCFSHFILGMLAAQMTLIAKKLFYTACAILLFVCILEWFHYNTWQTPLGHTWMSIIWLNYIPVMFIVLIQTYLSQGIYLPKIISIPLQKMGKLSYPFYLIHFLVIHFFILHQNYLTTYNKLNFLILFILSISSAFLMQKSLTVFTTHARNIFNS